MAAMTKVGNLYRSNYVLVGKDDGTIGSLSIDENLIVENSLSVS